MKSQPGTVDRLKEILTTIPAGKLSDNHIKQIDTLIALHKHTDPWTKSIAKYLQTIKQGQEPLL